MYSLKHRDKSELAEDALRACLRLRSEQGLVSLCTKIVDNSRSLHLIRGLGFYPVVSNRGWNCVLADGFLSGSCRGFLKTGNL